MRIKFINHHWLILFLILNPTLTLAQGGVTVQGYVRDSLSRETLPGVHVLSIETQTGTITNNYGFYSITLPPESTQLVFSYVGYGTKHLYLYMSKNLRLDVDLQPKVDLEIVTVSAERPQFETPALGAIRLPIIQAKAVPAVFGEKDVMKALQLLPGVQGGNEGTSGLFVRGGGHDQNLIILDDAIVYNVNHLFGFFSLFNGNAIKDVGLYKGGFPARYGGRLSSIVDITMREGNMNKYEGEAGIGLISSRFSFEGPIVKEKASFLLSGRRTYLDRLITPFMPDEEKIGYFFYDLNAKMNYVLNENNRFFLSGFFGKDKLSTSYIEPYEKTVGGLNWHNALLSARLSSILPKGLFVNNTLVFSQYRTGYLLRQIDIPSSQEYYFNYQTGIRDYSLKSDFFFNPWPFHTFRFGGVAIAHEFQPRLFEIRNELVGQYRGEEEKQWSVEAALYAENEFTRNQWMYNIGFRLSFYNTLKQSRFKPEPRITIGYLYSPLGSVKASYSEMNQHIHLLSNTGGSLPTDIWLPAGPSLLSQSSKQFSLGWNRRLERFDAELTLEGYFKQSDNILTYREGAHFFFIDDQNPSADINWEDNVSQGISEAFGIEFLIHKKKGKLNGWFAYTWSEAFFSFNEINNGENYPANFDRRHNLSLTLSYSFSSAFQVSSSWVFMSGHPITLPLHTSQTFRPIGFLGDQGMEPGFIVDYYTQRNNYLTENYHRLDLSFRFIKNKRFGDRVWEVGVYNAYNRMNPFSYNLITDRNTGQRKLRKTTLFPLIPSVTYLFKF
ncbi:MAG: TonB-dependent receptor [Bacteroidales bacterium]|nr:TonB-dependent receptor [Bacteroidales bacterium]NLM92244.1 TonB-dependent receptor [Bacteroidales bacterium]